MAKLLSMFNFVSYHVYVTRTMATAAASGSGHVLLGGGTGFIGSAFHHLLKNKGYNVTVISRMPGPQRLTWFDVTSNGLPEDVTAVVNLAGQNVLDPMRRWTPGFKQNVRNSRVNTTHTLAQAIIKAKQKPKVFVSISGVGIYKPSTTVEYDEDSDVSLPFDFLSELCHEWEEAAKLPGEDVRSVIVRSGVVLGRQGGMIKQLYIPFFFGLGGPVGSGKQYMPWIHIADTCNLLLFAIENSNVTGILNGVAPQVITNGDFAKAFAGALHRPAFVPLPEFAVNIMFGKERAKMMTEGQKVLPKRVLQYDFKYMYPNITSAAKEVSKFFYSKEKLL